MRLMLLLLVGCAGLRAATVEGEWQGKITKLRAIVKLAQDGDKLRGEFVSVDQGNIALKLDDAPTFEAGTLHFGLKMIGATFEGKMSGDGNEIAGVWQQGSATIPMVLRRPGWETRFHLKPSMRGKVAFTPCRTIDDSEALCGTYEVWENRESKSGRKLTLSIQVLPSTSAKPQPDPVFALAGGPGESAIEAFPLAPYIAALQKRREIVLIDQRGTGKSAPLPCQVRDMKVAQQVIGQMYAADRLKACRADLEKNADLTQYTTSIAVDDFDEVRAAMGYSKINLLGGSYGTKSSLVFLHRHEDAIRTVTLKAVAPPQYRLPLPFARTIQDSLEGLFHDCEKDGDCHKEYPELRANYRAAIERLTKEAAVFEIYNAAAKEKQKVTLPRGMFVANLRLLLYMPQLVPLMPFILQQAGQGDFVPFGKALLVLVPAVEPGISRGLFLSVVCAEDVPFITDADIKKETDGTDLGDFQVRAYREYCSVWPKGTPAKDYFEPIRTKVPVLLISGENDPATPPAGAKIAAQAMTNARLITVASGTHATSNACIDGLIAQFVADAAGAKLDATCAEKAEPPHFVTPDQAKRSPLFMR